MKQFFCLGSYTEPILFGTGEVFQGKGKGVSICRFEDGLIETVSTLSVRNPSFVCIDEERRKLYAVNEMKEYGGAFGGGVTQIGYSPDGGMRVEADFNTGGTDPCHIEIAPNGRFLSIANFASGAVSVFARDEAGNILRSGRDTAAGAKVAVSLGEGGFTCTVDTIIEKEAEGHG